MRRSDSARWAAAALAALGTVAFASTASAFCRTTTCDPNVDCQFDRMTGCAINGIPLSWPTQCVSFGVQRAASPLREIDFETARNIIGEAFSKWLGADCGSGMPEITIHDLGAISCADPAYNQNDPNANVWMFRDEGWPYTNGLDPSTQNEVSSATLALTTITFNFETGEIYDADVEVNSRNVALTTSLEAAQFDLPSIVQHEAGHFLGLSHSFVPGATMRPGYIAGDTSLRELTADDQAGICAVYPPGRVGEPNPGGACGPRHGFSRECASAEEGGCCSTAPGRPSPGDRGIWLAMLAALGVAFGYGRRRARV